MNGLYSIVFLFIFYAIICVGNIIKNKKLNLIKTIPNLLFESFFHLLLSYVLVILSLRIIKNINISHTFTSIFEGRLKFVLKFNGIAILFYTPLFSLSYIFRMQVLQQKRDKNRSIIFSTIFVFLLVWLFMLVLYIDMMFPGLSVDQILFTLTTPVTGTPTSIIAISYFMLLCIPLLCTIFHFILAISGTYITLGKKEKILFPISFKRKWIASFALFIIFFTFFSIKLELLQFLKRELRGNSTFYEENYINPKDVTFTFPEDKKNLIFIYLESMEAEVSCYAKEGVNLIPELTKLGEENLSFSHNDKLGGPSQLAGTSFSVASICCTHVGLPLLVSIDAALLSKNKYFFNGAEGLGDILKKGGYNCSFIVGSKGNFGGQERLLATHSFDFKALEYYRKIGKVPEDYMVWWGIEDTKLVEFAKEELLDLAKKEKPFAFSVFFEDTHFPEGYICEECENKYPKQIHNVFSCMSRRIGKFVEWIKEQEFYQNSVIVILGDHLYMGDDLYDNKNAPRHAYNAFINVDKSHATSKNRAFATFDFFPTIVESLGITYDKEGLGLGRSLFSGKPTLLEQMGFDALQDVLQAKSNFYRYSLLSKDE